MPARRPSPALVAFVLLLLLAPSCSRFQIDRGVQVEASGAALGDVAARTMAPPTGAYRAIYTYTVEPATAPAAAALDGIEVVVDGRYDQDSGLSWAELDPDSESGVGSGEVGDVEAVSDPEAGVIEAQLDHGEPWTPLPFAQVPPAPGGLRHATADVLVLLALAAHGEGQVTSGGQAQVLGVDTALLRVEKVLGAGVRGDADLTALQAILGVAELGPLLETTVTYDVYIDADRTVRRIVATFDLTPVVEVAGLDVQAATERVQVDFAELGSSPPVTLPPDEEPAAG
jgi:hypothetical protein